MRSTDKSDESMLSGDLFRGAERFFRSLTSLSWLDMPVVAISAELYSIFT